MHLELAGLIAQQLGAGARDCFNLKEVLVEEVCKYIAFSQPLPWRQALRLIRCMAISG